MAPRLDRNAPTPVLRLACATVVAMALLVPRPALPAKAAAAKPAAKVRTGLENLEKQVREFTLLNGMRFLVVERHQAPVFSFQTVVGSGAANDGLGTTGLAHMMEHMAFKGTAIVGTTSYPAEAKRLQVEEETWSELLAERLKGARADSAKLRALEASFGEAQEASRKFVVSNGFTATLEKAGAQNVNAFTADDITAYQYSLPSNQLELWELMEGGRMAYPVFREFYKERDVVYEERRMRTESSPIGGLVEEFIHAAFVAHPYGFGGIGHPSDLRTFSRTQAEEFYRVHYVGKNMTVAVVGDVTPLEVERLAQRYFKDVSNGPLPMPITTVEPRQTAERRVLIESAAQPIVLVGWHIPAASDPQYAAFKALANLLGGGDYARLTKSLVKEQKIATQVSAFTGFPGEMYPNLLGLLIIPASGQDPVKVEQAVYAALDEVQNRKPLLADELNGYKVRVKAEKISAVSTNAGLAAELSQAQALYGDWREFFREQERVQSLTPADLMAAMKQALIRSNRTVGLIQNPAPQAGNEGGH